MPSPSATLTDPREMARGLAHVADDVWFARESEAISYLSGGNTRFVRLEEGSFWFAHRNECIKSLVRAVPPPGTIFDIGGGNGYVAAGLMEDGHSVVLVEPNADGAANARHRGVPLVLCASLMTANFRDSVLPAVGLFDVLEHVNDHRAFLAEIHRCLKPNGRLFLTVPAWNWLWSFDDVRAGHYRRYTLSNLRRLLEEAGFAIRFCSYMFALLPLPLFLARSVRSLFGRRALPEESYDRLHSQTVPYPAQAIFDWERRRIGSLKPVFCGTSCLVAAEKR